MVFRPYSISSYFIGYHLILLVISLSQAARFFIITAERELVGLNMKEKKIPLHSSKFK